MTKFERKFGKYAIQNLSIILIICYAIGYLFQLITPLNGVLNYLSLNPYLIVRGQIWRLVTWILMPPSSFSLLTLVTLYFYYSIGRTLERTWGDYRYNLYIFGGMLFTILGAFLVYIYFVLFPDNAYSSVYGTEYMMQYIANNCVSTYYINMSIFLAFALTFPEAEVLLMFIIPVKMKWMGLVYGIFLVYEVIVSNSFARVMIVMSLLNFIVFFIWFRKNRFGSPRMRMQQARRRKSFNENVRNSTRTQGISKHKCAICGRTDTDFPDLEFRFCSKCKGNYEYCQDHLFTHKHVE